MASPNLWPAGLGGTGAEIAEIAGDYFSGSVQWLDTVLGNNSNAGTERELPVATLAQAVTNSAANGIIAIEAGSYEALTGAQTLNLAGLTLVGLGIGSNRPRYTAAGAIAMFNITAAATRIINIYFPASTTAPTSRISTTAAETEINGCYFECGINDTGAATIIGANAHSCRLINSSWVTTASRPAIGVSVTGAVTDLHWKNIAFDGGSYGWTDYALKISGAATRIFGDGCTRTNRSDFGITVTGTTYQIFGDDPDAGSRVLITA